MSKSTGEERADVAYTSTSQFIIKGSQGKNLEAGADAEDMEECYLLAGFSCLAQPAFLQNPGPPA